ncbi:hypothetical protein J2W42_006049 [Rhizobium tibeticum]|uniref:Uncharacterized protein n=1 Tax=Rhizobium tibeticum TaxID=501024 RepID=A0A1H8JAG1_9HYPH|nr:hypothetical protein [Rhizobium tibeticum]SEH75702.1 hypothetical protein RTCCBAU85039_2173 [Rhizobium tibeticum]SEN77601.1 hypothetical protein SAMN05216228_1007167 [Rhizobium tibeticum]
MAPGAVAASPNEFLPSGLWGTELAVKLVAAG